MTSAEPSSTSWRTVPRHPRRRASGCGLTAIYGGLFLVSGAGLLADFTYALVRNATEGVLCREPTARSSVDINRANDGHGASYSGAVSLGGAPYANDVTPRQEPPAGLTVRTENANDLHQLLVYSGLALADHGDGRFRRARLALAGLVLRPLRTITAWPGRSRPPTCTGALAMDGPNDELKESSATPSTICSARLEAFVHAQRQFVANASHELRTPLAFNGRSSRWPWPIPTRMWTRSARRTSGCSSPEPSRNDH